MQVKLKEERAVMILKVSRKTRMRQWCPYVWRPSTYFTSGVRSEEGTSGQGKTAKVEAKKGNKPAADAHLWFQENKPKPLCLKVDSNGEITQQEEAYKTIGISRLETESELHS